MPNAVYINKGTQLQINGEAGADYAFSMEGVANAAGRVSAQIDLGAAPRAYLYRWDAETQWQATPTQYGKLDFYLAFAPDDDSTMIDGDVGASDAALGDVDMRTNLLYIGSIVSENAAASEVCKASGIVEIASRYVTVCCYNAAGATINATDSNSVFYLTPIYDEVQ